MPVRAVARQPRRFHAEDGSNLPIAQSPQQAFKAGAACSGSRDSEIVVDDVDILPAQRTCPIGECILPALAFEVMLHLIRRGLADIHTRPPGKMIRCDLVHRCPPSGFSWPTPASTAPVPGGVAVVRPAEVVWPVGPAFLRSVVVCGLLGVLASRSSWSTLCSLAAKEVTMTRCNSSSTRTGRRAAGTIFAYAASGWVIHAGIANGAPSPHRTT